MGTISEYLADISEDRELELLAFAGYLRKALFNPFRVATYHLVTKDISNLRQELHCHVKILRKLRLLPARKKEETKATPPPRHIPLFQGLAASTFSLFLELCWQRATSRALPLWVHMWLPWDAIAYPLLTVQTRMILAKDVDISYPDLVLDHIAPNEHLENFWDAGWGLVILEHAITAHAFEWLAQRGDPTLWEGTLFLAAVDVMLHPLTVLRVNLQSGKFNNATQCIRAIYQQDGLYGFFKGWTVAVTSACFELGLDLLISRITQ